MLLMALIRLVFNIVGTVMQFVFPALPASAQTVFSALQLQIVRGLPWIFAFFDVGLVSQLIAWWIGFGLLMAAWEFAYHVWMLIQGTADTDVPSVAGDGIVMP